MMLIVVIVVCATVAIIAMVIAVLIGMCLCYRHKHKKIGYPITHKGGKPFKQLQYNAKYARVFMRGQ